MANTPTPYIFLYRDAADAEWSILLSDDGNEVFTASARGQEPAIRVATDSSNEGASKTLIDLANAGKIDVWPIPQRSYKHFPVGLTPQPDKLTIG